MIRPRRKREQFGAGSIGALPLYLIRFLDGIEMDAADSDRG